MQDFRFQITRALHDEHAAATALLQRLSAWLGQHGADAPPDAADAGAIRLLGDLAAAVEVEITVHFAFEEEALFPFLDDNGETDLGELYVAEHRVILPLGVDAAARARAARLTGFDAAGWAEFRRIAGEFADYLTRHAEAEEMALIPLLEDLLDEDSDERLAVAYDAMRG